MFTVNEIGARIRAEDNRATAIPIYVVQRRRRVYGFDPDYAEDTKVWLDCEGHEADAEERKPLDEAYDLGNDIPEGWTLTAYQDTWDFVMPFFTEGAAQRYLEENKHNLRPEARIYVESGYRNAEWEAIRKFLAALPDQAADGTAKPETGTKGGE